MATNNSINSNIPIEASKGGSNATSYTQSNGILVWNGTRFVNYTGPQIDSSGRYSNTSQPIFEAVMQTTQANQTGDGTLSTVIFDTSVTDQGSNYNASTGVYTVPVTGNYLISYGLTLQGVLPAHTYGYVAIQMDGVATNSVMVNPAISMTNNNLFSISASVVRKLSATNTIKIQSAISNGTKVIGFDGNESSPGKVSWFSAALIG